MGALSVWVSLSMVVAGACSAPSPPAAAAAGRGEGPQLPAAGSAWRPAGVALDPPAALPPGQPSAAATEGLAVLLAPVDPSAAFRVVDAYFAALAAESVPDLERLLDHGAEFRLAPRARAEGALNALRRRFERLDYTALAAEVPYRRSEREVSTARSPSARAEPGAPAVLPSGDDVVIRVPVNASVGTLLGSEVVLLLRKKAGTYKIGEIIEDFRLP